MMRFTATVLLAFSFLAASDGRAGQPICVAWYARPSETPAYRGYYAGGGSALGGDHRNRQEGTWGWDYSGWILPRRTALYWNHGRRYQGGTTGYKTDGPPVPDVPAALKSASSFHR